jgi:hypothetical protein
MSYDVDGRTVTMPVVVRDALAASASFVVPAAAVQGWLPAGLTARLVLPGRALLSLTAVHYRENDLGSYHELAIGVLVRRGIFIHRLPVDETFSCAAGRQVWGFPKTVEDLTVTRDRDRIVCRWDAGGAAVLRLAVDARGARRMRTTRQYAFSLIGGRVHRSRFLMRATAFGARPGGARIELGDGTVADELRATGLPKRAMLSLSMGRMQARFEAPQPV